MDVGGTWLTNTYPVRYPLEFRFSYILTRTPAFIGLSVRVSINALSVNPESIRTDARGIECLA